MPTTTFSQPQTMSDSQADSGAKPAVAGANAAKDQPPAAFQGMPTPSFMAFCKGLVGAGSGESGAGADGEGFSFLGYFD